MTSNLEKEKLIPAIPPETYKGPRGAWMNALMERGLWDGGRLADVLITESLYKEILAEVQARYYPDKNI